MSLKSVIIGASAGLGRALAEELAKKGHELFLVASDARDLAPICTDLQIRFGQKTTFFAADIRTVAAAEIREACLKEIGKPDCLFLVSGQSIIDRDFDHLTEDEAEQLIEVNFSAPARLAMIFLSDLEASERGACVGIGSIAQARARSRNTIYAASKQALEFFFQGLRHRLSASKCSIQFYRVGYMATQMTFGQKSVIPMAEPSAVAKKIVARLERDQIGYYLPSWWKAITRIYRWIPWFVFRRMKA